MHVFYNIDINLRSIKKQYILLRSLWIQTNSCLTQTCKISNIIKKKHSNARRKRNGDKDTIPHLFSFLNVCSNFAFSIKWPHKLKEWAYVKQHVKPAFPITCRPASSWLKICRQYNTISYGKFFETVFNVIDFDNLNDWRNIYLILKH